MSRSASIIAAAMLLCGPASADQAACVLKAADALPKIAGMKIGKSAVEPVPMPPGWPAGVSAPVRVTISWEAAGQAARWAYLCATDAAGNARVQRLKQ